MTSSMIARYLVPGDEFHGETLTDAQAGIEMWDGVTYVDKTTELANLGHTLVAKYGTTTVVHIATAETDRYMWQGVGATAEQATDALMSAWYAHADAVGADPDYLSRDQVNVMAAPLGQGFRDWDPLPRP